VQHTFLARAAVQQHHAPVPQSRPLPLPSREVAIHVLATRLREWPCPWLNGDLDRIKRGDLNRLC
jgi:hypothetical protein